jgi:hypothetical protein
MSAKNTTQLRAARAQQNFRVFPGGSGHWYAYKDDGLVAGIFFNRDAALRFVRDERSASATPERSAALGGDIAKTPAQVPMAFSRRRAAILAQLAFVGFLLIGRVAAGVVDASVMPAFDSTIVSGSPQVGSAN